MSDCCASVSVITTAKWCWSPSAPIHVTGERRIIAVGRMNKLHAGNEAEVAVLVSDQYQKLGLGNELLRRVIQIARDEKLSRVSAEMLPDNVAMQVITKRLGFRLRRGGDPMSIRAYLDL